MKMGTSTVITGPKMMSAKRIQNGKFFCQRGFHLAANILPFGGVDSICYPTGCWLAALFLAISARTNVTITTCTARLISNRSLNVFLFPTVCVKLVSNLFQSSGLGKVG